MTDPTWKLTSPPLPDLPAGAAAGWNDPTLWLPPPTSRVPDVPAPPTGPDAHDAVGQRVGPDSHELFVSCEASVALRQQFEQRQPEYLAWHDVGPAGGRRLLAGVAAAGRRPLQRLSIRRRGYGDELAALSFLELPTSDDRLLRIYTTDVDATDPHEREAIARTLLAHARLGVVMVAGGALRDPEAALQPLAGALSQPPWPGRHLLLMPLGPALRLAAVGQDLAVRFGLQVVTSPVAHRPSEAWQFVLASITRLKNEGTLAPPKRQADLFQTPGPGEPAAAGPITAAAGFRTTRNPYAGHVQAALEADDAAAALPPTEPSALALPPSTRSMPVAGLDEVDAAPTRLAHLLRAASGIAGFMAACVFELDSGRAVAHLGQRPDAQSMARHAAALMTAFGDAGRGLGLGNGSPEGVLTVGDRHLVLRPLVGEPGLGLHLVLDRHATDTSRLRSALLRLDALQSRRLTSGL